MTEEKNFLNNFFEIMSVKTVTIDNRGVISDYSTISTEEDKIATLPTAASIQKGIVFVLISCNAAIPKIIIVMI